MRVNVALVASALASFAGLASGAALTHIVTTSTSTFWSPHAVKTEWVRTSMSPGSHKGNSTHTMKTITSTSTDYGPELTWTVSYPDVYSKDGRNVTDSMDTEIIVYKTVSTTSDSTTDFAITTTDPWVTTVIVTTTPSMDGMSSLFSPLF
jgi:hypothetical protein